MLGIWDTVKTADFGNDDHPYDHNLADNVKAAYHAMALDELRTLFPVLRLPDSRAHEVWFAGNHCDVGGGYPEDGLSNISLQWMLDRALEHGLRFHNKLPIQDISQVCHDESTKALWIAIGLRNLLKLEAIKTPRKVMPNDLIHKQTEVKMEKYGYEPTAKIPSKVSFVEC